MAKGKFRPNFQISFSNIFEKQIASCESKGRGLSFEWSHHRISSTNSRVRVTSQNSIKHSGSERVKQPETSYTHCIHRVDNSDANISSVYMRFDSVVFLCFVNSFMRGWRSSLCPSSTSLIWCIYVKFHSKEFTSSPLFSCFVWPSFGPLSLLKQLLSSLSWLVHCFCTILQSSLFNLQTRDSDQRKNSQKIQFHCVKSY